MKGMDDFPTVGANSSPVDNLGLQRLSNRELLARTEWLAKVQRRAACDLVLHIAEIDRRKAALEEGYTSTFDYCAQRLRHSEGAAYRLIRAARSVRALPAIEAYLRDGSLSLESVALIHPFLDEDDAAQLVLSCRRLPTRAVEALLARRKTAPPRRDSIRHIGMERRTTPIGGDTATGTDFNLELQAEPPARKDARALVQFSFIADEAFEARLRRAKLVLLHKYPEGRLEDVLSDALEALLDRRDMDRIVARRAKWRERAAARKPPGR